ncbi:MAG: GNAT family N-acetyltransferase [bacterium]|nr:GNAT family N-acetyltransferase [bacterium]
MIRYRIDCIALSSSQLTGFFVGWPNPPSPETHLRILQQSDYVVLAIDDETNQVVGFVTAISDKILSAYIPLLEVLPEYQFRGIGRELMERMLTQLDGLYMIDLTCDPNLQKGYRQLGFQKMTAMMIRNFDCQSGRRG